MNDMKSNEPGTECEGWGCPLRASKCHYFRGARSLCGRWMYTGNLDTLERHSPVDCADCTRRRDRELKKEKHGTNA